MSEGKFAEACPKFASSYRLDPGLGTLLNLGVCYKGNDQTASAWSTFREAAMLARRNGEQERETVARQQAESLAARVGCLGRSIVVHGATCEEPARAKAGRLRLQPHSAAWGLEVSSVW